MNQVGVPTVQSLEIVAQKWRYAPLSFLISSIKLHQVTGGNLANLFQQVAKSFRRQQSNKKAMQAVLFQNKVSSLVVSSLVPIILLLSISLSKNYRVVVFGEPVARVLIIAAGFWWAIGVFVMWKALRVRV
jgi:tight adherence protein B